jgi:hypothetical protein
MHFPCVLGKLLYNLQVTGLCISCDIDRFIINPKYSTMAVRILQGQIGARRIAFLYNIVNGYYRL